MLSRIEEWIDKTNLHYAGRRVSCLKYAEVFQGFYTPDFLRQAYFVVVDEIPKPDFQELRDAGFDDFLDMEVHGITYKDTYYVLSTKASDEELHFHELVHVVQWQCLGPKAFLERYLEEVKKFKYEGAPLEKVAYGLQYHFEQGKEKFDIPSAIAAWLLQTSEKAPG